jgi:hypothetical protein
MTPKLARRWCARTMNNEDRSQIRGTMQDIANGKRVVVDADEYQRITKESGLWQLRRLFREIGLVAGRETR